MILLVDNEHVTGHEAAFGQMILAARTWIAYRLQDMTGEVCLVQRYPDVTPDLIEKYEIKAVFISGNGSDPDVYEPEGQDGIRSVIRDCGVPMFGFCGGHQLIAETLGVPIERIGKIPAGEVDLLPDFAPGWKTELGYGPVDLDPSASEGHPLLAGLGSRPIFRHAHSWEIKSLPSGFTVLGSTDATSIQIMSDDDRCLVGTQFHPEYWTDEHPAGEQLIKNFCSMAGLLPSSI